MTPELRRALRNLLDELEACSPSGLLTTRAMFLASHVKELMRDSADMAHAMGAPTISETTDGGS